MPLISFVFPIYNEEGNIDVLHSTMSEVLRRTEHEVELIFVNDGSTDGSLARLVAISEVDPRVRVIDFSRNFGHQVAVTAGIDAALGDAIVIMDADMQDPPEVSLELIRAWEAGYDVAYAQRRSRQDGVLKRTSASVFYRMLNALSDIDIPRDTGDFRLIDRRVAEQLKLYGEHDRFLRGMVSDVGFRQVAVPFDRHARHAGETGYPVAKMLRFAADGIMGFSSKPLQLISRLGYTMAALAVVGGLYALFVRLFFPSRVVEGWTFIVLTLLLVGGLQLIMMGIMAAYIGRIYREVKRRPLYGIQATYGTTVDDGRSARSVRRPAS